MWITPFDSAQLGAAHGDGAAASANAKDWATRSYVRINETLKRAPTWEPPPGFARKVVVRASLPAPNDLSTTRLPSQSLVQAATLGLLIATACYAGMRLLVPVAPVIAAFTASGAVTVREACEAAVSIASQALVAKTLALTWGWVGFSYLVAAWFARPARA
jgi:hypothetical protein